MSVKQTCSLLNTPVTLSAHSIYFILCVLFFCSGCATLIYQLMWQRMLFAMFGMDLVSVSIIVSVFMVGLGVGGLFGGYLADRLPTRLLALYIVIELYVAIFGYFSPTWIGFFGSLELSHRYWVMAPASYLILAAPTLLMGAALPILIIYVNRYKQNIGDSVGGLYFANTLGGAVGVYFSGFVLLHVMGGIEAINRAVWLNLFVVLAALLMFRRQK